MSVESVQFVELARQHAAARTKLPDGALLIWRWCPICGHQTDHISEMIGQLWERITCQGCGHSQEYKVK